MNPIRHTLVDAFVKWKSKKLDTELKEKAFSILEPSINDLVTEKTLTEEEKEQVKKESEKILELIDKHFDIITTRNIQI